MCQFHIVFLTEKNSKWFMLLWIIPFCKIDTSIPCDHWCTCTRLMGYLIMISMKNRCYQFLFNCSSHKKRKRRSRSHSSSSRESDGRKKRHKKRKHHHAKYSDSSDSSSSTSSSTSSSDTSSTESHQRKKKKRKKKRQHHKRKHHKKQKTKRKHHKRHQTSTEEDIKPDLGKYMYFCHLKNQNSSWYVCVFFLQEPVSSFM